MYVSKRTTVNEVNFLASARFQTFTHQINQAGVAANAEGRRIVPAGTIYPANDNTAVGILLHDVDVTEGNQPGSVLVEGYVIAERLPVAPAEAARTALKEIKFR